MNEPHRTTNRTPVTLRLTSLPSEFDTSYDVADPSSVPAFLVQLCSVP